MFTWVNDLWFRGPNLQPSPNAARKHCIKAVVVLSALLLNRSSSIGQGSPSPAVSDPPSTPGVLVNWQNAIQPITTVVNIHAPCLQITPDIDKGSLIAANRCSGTVTLMAVREMNPSIAPFVPTAQNGERQFAIVTVPQYDYVELTQPAVAFYFVPLSIPGMTNTSPYLRCLVDPTAGKPLSGCDSTNAFGANCSCSAQGNPPAAGHMVIAPPATPVTQSAHD